MITYHMDIECDGIHCFQSKRLTGWSDPDKMRESAANAIAKEGWKTEHVSTRIDLHYCPVCAAKGGLK